MDLSVLHCFAANLLFKFCQTFFAGLCCGTAGEALDEVVQRLPSCGFIFHVALALCHAEHGIGRTLAVREARNDRLKSGYGVNAVLHRVVTRA